MHQVCANIIGYMMHILLFIEPKYMIGKLQLEDTNSLAVQHTGSKG